MLVLQVVQGSDRGKSFELPANEPQLIGRSSEALPITDTSVSRRHAELTPDDGAWYLGDLESANGTFLNGHRIHDREKLAPGDQIRCGATLLVVSLRDDERRPSPIRLVDETALEVQVEKTDAGATTLTGASGLKAAEDHLRILFTITALTAETFERQALLEGIMAIVFDEFGPDRGFVLLGADPEGVLDAPVVRYRERPKTKDEGRIPVSRTIIRHALREREGVLSTNAMDDQRFEAGDSVRDYGIRSALCVPIIAGERTFGVIHIDSQQANFTFNEAQLRLLSAIGKQAGLALLSAERVATHMQTERLATMGQTVASLSHSIKNILQGLRGGADAVQLALNREDLTLAREGWPILARNLDRIYTLTMNMLSYSRPSSLEVELIDLHAIIGEAADLTVTERERRRVGLILDLDEGMPPVPADGNGIHQVLVNLLMNAVEALPPRQGIITIKTLFDENAHEVRIDVSDNGPGIEPARQEAVFQAFKSTKGQRGSGLGLAVSRKIVQEHGGRIELESESGSGATFRIVIPSEQSDLDSSDTKLPRPISGDPLQDPF